jgi:hypothetical protein
MATHELALSRHPSWRPGTDEWATPEGQYIRLYSRLQGGERNFSVHLIGPDGKARQESGGPQVPGPWAFLVCQATVIAARPQLAPHVVAVAIGDQLRLRCYDEPHHQAPVLVHTLAFRIEQGRPAHDPHLTLPADPTADQ